MTSILHRLLQDDHTKRNDGPIAVLIVVCILFCFIWTPMLCQRHCRVWRRRHRQQQTDTNDAEVIRVSLSNLNLLGLEDQGLGNRPPSARGNPIQAMSLEDRREFIKNVLVSKTILNVSSKQGPPTDDGGFDEDTLKEMPKKKTLLLADIVDVESTTKHVTVEPCPICLNEYNEGEILCWSQNSNCTHCFHRDCMEEWLLRHEECPCCRHNYLSLNGDDDDQVVIPTATAEPGENAFLRGVHLFYLLSRLQSLVDTRPNTTIRLEGVELANGRRGSLEIQRATDTSFDVGGRGLNVRVASQDGLDELDDNHSSTSVEDAIRLDLSEASQR